MDGNPKRRYGKRRYFVLAVAEPPFPPFHGCFQKTGSRVKRALARDDTVYSLVDLFRGEPFHHSTFSPFINPADPVDPVIRVLFPFHHIVAPNIYGGRLGLICITLPDRGLPAVILNLVRDDLRMMAPKPVAARDGAMKDIAECVGYLMRLSNN
jgi:hypothetical protein